MPNEKRVGILTGGGDAPGLNPAIKGLVYRGSELGLEVIGLFDGWRSLMNPAPDVLPLDRETVRRWDRDGGTNLGSSRTNPFKQLNEAGEPEDRSQEVIENIERLKLDVVVACGGEDTLGVAAVLAQRGVPIVGIPKTIDKDLAGTDYTLGFDTALRNISEVIEWLGAGRGSDGSTRGTPRALVWRRGTSAHHPDTGTSVSLRASVSSAYDATRRFRTDSWFVRKATLRGDRRGGGCAC
jgi:6-phosphofructokinase 1